MASLSFHPTRIKHPIHALNAFTETSYYHLCAKKLLHRKNSKNLHFPPCFSVSESSVSSTPLQTESGKTLAEDDSEEENEDDPTAESCYFDPGTDPGSIKEWQVDFCSRPILEKKIWELVVCDESLSLQYTKYFPNNVINSVTLKNAIGAICDDLGVPLPEKIRFFRSQMQTIIMQRAWYKTNSKQTGGCDIMFDIKKCSSLVLWLEERYETIHTRHPRFQKGLKPILSLDNPFPVQLPENLYGEKWAFVQLPFPAVAEEVASLQNRFAFGAGLDLDLLGIEVGEKTLVPGLAVGSFRAKPLAAWMNGLEVCSVESDVARASIILSIGISTLYVYATYKKTPVATCEAEAWEAAKKACGGSLSCHTRRLRVRQLRWVLAIIRLATFTCMILNL